MERNEPRFRQEVDKREVSFHQQLIDRSMHVDQYDSRWKEFDLQPRDRVLVAGYVKQVIRYVESALNEGQQSLVTEQLLDRSVVLALAALRNVIDPETELKPISPPVRDLYASILQKNEFGETREAFRYDQALSRVRFEAGEEDQGGIGHGAMQVVFADSSDQDRQWGMSELDDVSYEDIPAVHLMVQGKARYNAESSWQHKTVALEPGRLPEMYYDNDWMFDYLHDVVQDCKEELRSWEDELPDSEKLRVVLATKQLYEELVSGDTVDAERVHQQLRDFWQLIQKESDEDLDLHVSAGAVVRDALVNYGDGLDIQVGAMKEFRATAVQLVYLDEALEWSMPKILERNTLEEMESVDAHVGTRIEFEYLLREDDSDGSWKRSEILVPHSLHFAKAYLGYSYGPPFK